MKISYKEGLYIFIAGCSICINVILFIEGKRFKAESINYKQLSEQLLTSVPEKPEVSSVVREKIVERIRERRDTVVRYIRVSPSNNIDSILIRLNRL